MPQNINLGILFVITKYDGGDFLDTYKTTLEAAKLLKCSERNVQLLCKSGAIPGAMKLSGVWLLPEKAVLDRIKVQKPSLWFQAEQLYGLNANVHLASSGTENQRPERGCSVTQYSILEGITLVFQDIHEERLDYGCNMPAFPDDLIAIQHCREGRFEGEYPDGECIYMGPGCLSVNLPAWSPVSNSFPLSHYHGFYIAVLPGLAESSIETLEQILGPVGIDFSALLGHLSGKNRLALFDADPEISHLISSLYHSYSEGREECLRIQVLALLQLLSKQKVRQPDPDQYFPRELVNSIKEIRDYLISHPDQHIPLPELARRFRISLTAMKLCFKGVYGQSIGKYLREYRMQAAAEMLINTGLKIIDIAASLGYENASKFSEAFFACYGMNPSTYRKNFCPNGGAQISKEWK